ncbi:MAG: hypothetical protein CMO18_00900 [Thaumarchaeota archaeon]|nr:hypothetical protein [Nitrososphaerota archaeon]
MNKPLILLSLFLIATMCFVTIPSSVQADSQLDVLIKITQNTQAQIKKDIDQMNNPPQKIHDFYDTGAKQSSLLIQAVENEDDVSAKQHFIDAMIAFKQASLAISENEPQAAIVDHSSRINKYASNIEKLKIISTKLKTDIDFEKIDHLLALAKANNAQGKLEQAKDTLNEVASEGKQIQKLLYEISEQNKILKAKQFVQKHAERIQNLILQAKTFGLDKTANELEQSQLQLLQANTTNQIKQQFKIIIIHQQKVEQVKQVSQTELLRLQSLIEPLENKAKRLADDLQGNNAAANLLDNAFNLIEKTKQDIQDLQYVSGRIDTKNLDLTIGKNIETIKDLLMKVEKLIYTSS